MKVLLSLVLAIVTGVASAAPLPSFRSLPHYMTVNKCEPFSWAALGYLHSNGVPAVRICYGWSQFGGRRDYHAAVLFQWEGKIYFMDNNRMGPRRVSAKTDLGAVNHITADFYTHCWMVDDKNHRRAPRKLSELFAPAPPWLRELQAGPKR